MDQIVSSQSASARSLLYWLLADLFLNCPNERSVASLRRDLESLPDGSGLLAQLTEFCGLLPGDPPGINDLAVEYTRLFGALNPHEGPAPPYESVYRSSDVAHAVEHFYAKAGLVPDENCAPPDHFGVELRFLALLFYCEAEALAEGQETEANKLAGDREAFLDQHVRAWALGYLDQLKADARHPFYRALAAVTGSVLGEVSEE